MPEEVEEEAPIEPKEEKKEEPKKEDEPEPGNYFNLYDPYMFQDYQMMLNKMMVDQMKLMRQQRKYATKKQQKPKGRSQKIYDLFSDLANPKQEEETYEPQDGEEIKEEAQDQEEEHEIQENTTNFFERDYKNKEPVKEISPPKPTPEPEKPHYKHEYEEKIDQIGGFIRLPSRRDRLNFKIFDK